MTTRDASTAVQLQQVAQRATDLDRAEEFYSLLLGVPSVARFDPPGLLFFQVGGARLLLEQGAPSALHYFVVDSIDAAIARLGDRADVHAPAHPIFTHENDTLGPAGFVENQAFITDSEGNTVGLIEFTAVAPVE